MINFPKEFTLGDENAPVIGGGLLQPSVLAQVKKTAPELPAPNELQSSFKPVLAQPPDPDATQPMSAIRQTTASIQKKIYYGGKTGRINGADALDWMKEGYDYNSKSEGMVDRVYLDTNAVVPADWADKKYNGKYKEIKGKVGVLTAGTGYTKDEDGNLWRADQFDTVVTNREKDRARYQKDHMKMDSDFIERFPKLWSTGSIKQKAALVSFLHNVGNGYAQETSPSNLFKQMSKGDWGAIAENVRTWSHGKDGKPKNPLLESRRKRDYIMLTQNKRKK